MARICIVGAGAVGGHLAAKLARAGHQVSVVARGAHLEAIRRDGLRLDRPDDPFTVRVEAAASGAALGKQDVVILTGKAQHLPALAAEVPALLDRETPVVVAVNGVPWWWFHRFGNRPWRAIERLDPGGRIDAAVPRDRVLGCVIYSSNTLVAPGVVRSVAPQRNRFVLGEPEAGRTDRAEAVAALFAETDLDVVASPDIRQEIWQKLLMNMGNSATCCLTGARVGEMLSDPDVVALARRLNEEAVAIAASQGFVLKPLYSPEHVKASLASPVAGHKPSMLQDLEAGKPLELDAQFLAPQDFAREAGLATPVLDTVIPLLRLRARLAEAAANA